MNLFENPSDLSVYAVVLRFAIPAVSLLVVWRCAASLLRFRREPEVWAWLHLATGELIPVKHWENLLGRKKNADVVLSFATVSKNHAVLTRHDDGSWSIRDVGERGRVQVNGRQVIDCDIAYGDRLSLGGLEMTLEPISREEARLQSQGRTRAGMGHSPGLTLLLLTVLQSMVLLSLCLYVPDEQLGTVLIAFGELAALEWMLFVGQKLIRRSGFEIEALAFFLMTFGLSVTASMNPAYLQKQLLIGCAGIVLFLTVGLFLRSLAAAKRVRYLAAIAGLLLLAANLVLGSTRFGARNWLSVGGVSFQPSELVKVCFIFVGASTMERIVTKRNLVGFVVYAGLVCICLALIRDFGTALIFFVTFLVISYLRSGSYAALVLFTAAVGFAAVLAVSLFPYIAARFSTWGHIWDDPYGSGYQQTAALMCLASGGLFGLGLGNGILIRYPAAETDLVFAVVAEEGGLIVAVLLIVAVALLALFTVRSARVARSSFYTISACAAASILTVQTILNVFGTVDFLPLTGVTFPFVSHGGSSLLSCWGLLAFIKACDTRQNASFAVKLSDKHRRGEEALA